MDIRQVAELTDTLVTRLAPKVDQERADSIRASATAGAWEFAIPELAAVLARDQIPVTADDRDDLRRLLNDLHESTDSIDRLVIRTDTASGAKPPVSGRD